MLIATKRAAAQRTAPKYCTIDKSYKIPTSPSILKSDIGILLLCLQFPIEPELRQIGWGLFERLLRRYIGLVHASGISKK